MNQGCKQCPIEITIKPLWANGEEGYFMSATGAKLALRYGPAMQKRGSDANNGLRGMRHPVVGEKTHNAHRLMAYTYADEPCPIYKDSKGKPYKGIVHHVIENPYDIRVDNLIWWLTFKQHRIADNRRRILEKALPDMYIVPTVRLKQLQDPRITSDEDFQTELEKLRAFFSTHTVGGFEAGCDLMEYECTHHMER